MILIPEKIKKNILDTYASYYEGLSKISRNKIAEDVLSQKKIYEQVGIFERTFKEKIVGKKVLEIGSGFGIFVAVLAKDLGIDVYGVEPNSEGFYGSFEMSKDILLANDINQDRIINGWGEDLPFSDNSFDVIYSTNVLEHVQNPQKVMSEAIRVCREGGSIQIVIPNYGSFFDGHYACFYLPYQPKWLWKLWLKFVLRRDTSYVDTLRTEINYFSMKKIISPFVEKGIVEVVDYGERVFKERMLTTNFTAWAGLGKVSKILSILHKLKIVYITTHILSLLKFHSPLIISLRKK